ncbi:MAG: hypothetical protein KatS3mg111_2735 [Pirellulaceae bacterium]|nr:MAG: hypothetical protein KatS3mg111_2735 [Pirellulaceae bacterium]
MATRGMSNSRKLLARKRLHKQLKARRAFLETLEARQLLTVGPQLLGIQPNSGDLLESGEVLHVAPRELVFRFDDAAGIDPNSLNGIRLIRSGDDGVFERASAATDFGTGGQTLVEFFAQEPGEEGNGLQIRFTSAVRTDTRAPIVRVNGRVIDVELNANPALETRVEDLLQAFNAQNQTPATQLVFALRLRGSTTIGIGGTGANRTLTLSGANAAKAATNFGISNALEVRFVAREAGNAGLDIAINVTARDRGAAGPPIVTVTGKTIHVEINSNSRFPTTVQEFIDALNAPSSPSSALIEAKLVSGLGATRIGTAPLTYAPIKLTGVTDIEVTPAYVGLGDTNREVIMRFAEELPDDRYRIEILGQGVRTLRNVHGEAFNGGQSRSIPFELDLGAKIESIVPQPVRRNADGSLRQELNVIDVYFNDDDLIDVSTIATINGVALSTVRAQRVPFYLDSTDTIVFQGGTGSRSVLDPAFYQLFKTKDTLTNTDDEQVDLVSVRYYPDADRVTLTFNPNQLGIAHTDQLRLRIGTNESVPLPPVAFTPPADPGDSFSSATDLSSVWTPGSGGSQSVIIDSEILNPAPFVLDFPGANDEPGSRQIRYQEHISGGDTVDGISTILYNFRGVLGALNNSTLLNAITEQQKVRVREVLSLYEKYLGVRFVETQDEGLTIAVGDTRAVLPDDGVIDLNGPGAPFYETGLLLASGQPAVVMDTQDFDQSTETAFGGKFQRAVMQGIGRLLGIGMNEESADFNIQKSNSIVAPGVGSEIVLPGDADILHGRFLYRPDSTDIDLYQFSLPTDGKVSIEAFAERMRGTNNLLNTYIRLYQQNDQGEWVEIAANDDYYSSDSFIELELQQGNYIVGVSASGNNAYDPAIPGTGLGGTSQGQYKLRLDFQPPADAILRDATGTPVDGDADGTPGGVYNFWFRASTAANTKFVDKSASAGGNGSLSAPFKYIKDALAAAQPGEVVRIVGNGGGDGSLATVADNLAYEIGFDTLGRPLPDGATFDVPRGVTVMIDAGAILKMRRARVGVGSSSVSVDRSGGSLMVLGTPVLTDATGQVVQDGDGQAVTGSVYFTSISDVSLGKNANPSVTGSNPRAGDWGGLDFRNRVDAQEPGRAQPELLGQFNNYVVHADLRYGGGQVVIDGVSQTVAPVQMIDARPTIAYSSISMSADAAMSATPDSFAETNYSSPMLPGGGTFTLDYDRVGPDITGNRLLNNSINGLLVRVRTSTGTQLEKMSVQGRWDDTDIVHVLPENLEIQGTPGGAIQDPATGDYINRLDARLVIDPGTVVKSDGSRIEVAMGSQLIAEGTDGMPVVFTSLNDVRYGAGGTFDTANRGGTQAAAPGDWGGIYAGHTSSLSLDHAVVAYGGGTTRIEGGFADFNAIEVHQADARITNSRIEFSDVGTRIATNPQRAGRLPNAEAAIFVRGAQPVLADNIIYNNNGPAISINVGSLNDDYISDLGRSTGPLNRVDNVVGNHGPLIVGNHLDHNDINGMVVRGGQLSTEGVWDDTDIVHVVLDEIIVGDIEHVGGLRLVSSDEASLVVKLAGDSAGFTATGVPLDNDDRIGGAVQLLGNPDHPVVLTSLDDCSVGAGFTIDGVHQVDTSNSGFCSGESNAPDFVDVIVVMDESSSMGFAQQFAMGMIQDLDNTLRAAGIGNSAAGPNLFGLVGFGDINSSPRSIPVGANGALFGTSQEYVIASQQLGTAGAVEDGYQAIHFALDNYTFRENSERFIILVTDEDRDVVDASLDYDNTLAKLRAHDVTLEGILSATFLDEQGNRALALDAASNAYLEDGQGGFIVTPNGSVSPNTFTSTIVDYVDMVFDTNGLAGDISQIQRGGLTAQSFGAAMVNSIVVQAGGNPARAGDWRSVRLEQFSNDRNVAGVVEQESPLSTGPAANDTPDSAQYLGGLAPNEKAGDENQRLGYEIDGQIARPGDVDVYSFRAKAGTEVWLDIDRTQNSLDTVIELIDANGRTLALSDSSLMEEVDPSLLYAAADMPAASVNPMRKSANFYLRNAFDGRAKDLYSTNPQDAGFRVVLPGEAGAENLYHIRVRSSNRLPGDPVSQLVDPNSIGQGLTKGSYRLQVRIRELDEIPGSSVNYADIRFASNGIEIIGLPGNSPLLGENAEIDETAPGAPQNDLFSQAQFLGNLLETNRQAISVAGNLDDVTDVDWFSFDIDYQKIPASALREYFSTVFDLDYADGLGRPDTSMYVFDANGNLILAGLASAILDDQANPLNGADNADLSRGSAGNLDPFIGAYELPAGRYFLAVTNSLMVPAVMEAYTNPAFGDGEMRMAPIESIQYIAEDHIDTTGGTTAAPPLTPVLFPNSSIVDFNLADVALYVSQDVGTELTNIYIVNPFTGERRNIVGRGGFDVQDIAYRPNGQLRAFDRVIETNAGNADRDTLADYLDIDPGTAVFTDIGDFGADTNHIEINNGTPAAVASDDGWNIEAITFSTFDGVEHGFVAANRPTPPGEIPAYSATRFINNNGQPGFDRPGVDYFTNIIFEFDENTGAAISTPGSDKTGLAVAAGAGSAVRERARVETFTTDGAGNIVTQTSTLLAREVTSRSTVAGQPNLVINDGDIFVVRDGTNFPTRFEFDLGPQLMLNYNPAAGLHAFDGLQFTLDGTVFEFDTGHVVVVTAASGAQLSDGTTVTIEDVAGVTRTFEFDADGSLSNSSHIAVNYSVGSTQNQLVQALINAINSASGFLVKAEVNPGSNRIALRNASMVTPVTMSGSGVAIAGSLGVSPGATRIPILETSPLNELVGNIAAAMPSSVMVGYDSGRLNFAGAGVGNFASLVTSGLATDLGTTGGVGAGNIAVLVLAGDTATTVAQRIAQAANDAAIPNLSATANGDQVQFAGVFVDDAGPLAKAGIAPGGILTGIAVVGNVMYAVSNAGGLYRVGNPSSFQGEIFNSWVNTSAELVGIEFTGLSVGPQHAVGGQLRQLLFGIDADGRIHAFDTSGRLQPVFANGATSVDTGLTGANGLAFSTLDFNLWHTTTQRSNDPGHGLPDTPNDSRVNFNGGQSLYFGYEGPFANGVPDLAGPNAPGAQNSYNFPGGAAGVLESQPFDLSTIDAADLPVLYFNYRFDTEQASSTLPTGNNQNDYMRDSFRVYAAGEDGNWVLLATNNDPSANGLADDELDPAVSGNPHVQRLFDNNGQWRQARIPLDVMAGQSNVRLRIEFSTHGGFGYGLPGGKGPEIRTIAGNRLSDGQLVEINNQTFEIEMGPTLVLPSGAALSNGDSLVVEGVRYVFTDGTLSVAAPDVAVNFSAAMTAGQVATALFNAISSAPLAQATISGKSYTNESNDTLAKAENPGVVGDTIRIEGSGVIGDNAALTNAGEDVDLVRVHLDRGAILTVEVQAQAIGSSLDSYLRLFDAEGSPLAANDDQPGTTDSRIVFTAPESGTYYIGVSGAGNIAYRPTMAGTATAGSTGNYNLIIGVQRKLVPVVDGNRLQLDGAKYVVVPPDSAIVQEGAYGTSGHPVYAALNMTSNQVAQALRESIAEVFATGVTSAYPIRDNVLDLTGLVQQDALGNYLITAGPFGATTGFVGDQFGAFNTGTDFFGNRNNANPGALGAQNNAFEGVYLDDFIIGIASRGEMVMRASSGNTNFIQDPQLSRTNPALVNTSILVGPYQVEIRGGQEYGIPDLAGLSDSFIVTDTLPLHGRAADSVSVRFNGAADLIAGSTFTIGDGTRTLTFELDDIRDGLPVASGHVAVPFDPQAIDPVTGRTAPESAGVIAARIRDIINSPAVQSQLQVSASLLNGDRTGASHDTVTFFGNAAVDVPAETGQLIVTAGQGDQNRERPQGQVVVSNSTITNASGFGIVIDAGGRAAATNAPLIGSPRNTIVLNEDDLAPGVVVTNNALLFNQTGGINIVGNPATAGAPDSAVPFARVINNTIIGGTVSSVQGLVPTIYEGLVFDNGNLAFADAVVRYRPDANGGPVPIAGLDDPSEALGAPNFAGGGEPQPGEGAVSLGNGGQLVVQFTNNFLTGSNDSAPDLAVFEVGASEEVLVEVSADGLTYTPVGRASGNNPLIDLDAFGFNRNSRLSFVRLTDIRNQDGQSGDSVGADIDAVGALSSVVAETFFPGGTGISVTNNSTATIMNNVVVNANVGIDVDASSASTVIGGTVYQHNVNNVSGSASLGQFPLVLGSSTPVFLAAGNGNIYPAPASPIIDSSIDSLQDRPSLVAVKQPLGIAASPLLAPEFDIRGQLRVDDPAVETPSGLGENVFKDRGALDRSDFVGPSVNLLAPVDNDNDGADQNSELSVVELNNVTLTHFDIRILDGIEPSEPSSGTGVNDATVTSSSVLVYRNNQPLVEGVDYRFGYDATNGIIRLQPLAGIWRSESVYTIRFINSQEGALSVRTPSAYVDGEQFTIIDANGQQTTFEIDLGYVVTVPSTDGIQADVADGSTFIVDDGSRRLTFEFDLDGSTAAGHVPIFVGTSPTIESVGRAIENALNDSGLSLSVHEVTAGQLQIHGSRLVQFLPDSSGLNLAGRPGVRTAFGLQIPMNAGRPDGVDDGQTFAIDRNGFSVTFELDTNGSVLPGNIPVQFAPGASVDQIGAALVTAINAAAVGLTPVYDGQGLVRLGGDSNVGLDLSNTVLQQAGVPGQPAAIPIMLQLDADSTATSAAAVIKAAIDAQGLAGVVTTQFGTRLLLEGIQGISGAGASTMGPIRDLAGNPLKANQVDGTTTLTIFLGQGLDYGDAPAPYTSLAADNGPRHSVVNGLSLGSTVTTDADARLDDADADDGVQFTSGLFAAFSSDATISVTNTTGQTAYVSMWIDFNGDGVFATGERVAAALPVSSGQSSLTLSYTVPASAQPGTTYARVRLSTSATAVGTPVGPAPDGEVEDHQVTIQGNPYTNPANRLDVSGDEFVSPIDVLQVINYLNNPSTPKVLSLPASGVPPYVDVNGNGFVEPLDALIVINYLNSLRRSGGGEGEGAGGDALTMGWTESNDSLLSIGSAETVLASNWAAGLENLLRTPAQRPEPTPEHPVDAAVLEAIDVDLEGIDSVLSTSPASDPVDVAWELYGQADDTAAEDEDLFGDLAIDLGLHG